MGSLYWRHTWHNQIETSLWAGAAERHAEGNLALGNMPPTEVRFLFGADLHVPLSPSLAIVGAANFISPADTGTVDSYLGLAYYPGATAFGFNKQRFAPRLPVANSPFFAVDWR